MFKKATKEKSKLRCAIFGPSGSGKTFSALRISNGIGGSIAVIDTERGSASKYSDRFDFDVCDLEGKTIDHYIAAITEAGKAAYQTLIIDSLSHGWQELLEDVDRLAKTKYKGNTWSAWSDGTPKQKRLVNSILDFPGHVIATMRSKTEWSVIKTDSGKSKPERIGLAPEQGKGIEYEFDVLLEMSTDNMCEVIKDRTGKFQGKIIDKPGEDFGKELAAWLDEGVEARPRPTAQAQTEKPEPVINPTPEEYLRSLTAEFTENAQWADKLQNLKSDPKFNKKYEALYNSLWDAWQNEQDFNSKI